VKQALGKAFTIQCKEEMPIQVDGELIYAKDVEVRVMEKQFNFRY
jgi:diacylglycerol kinase family enzyme